MADYKFTRSANEEHVITLDSHLISASWVSGMAFAGQKAKFEVRTMFVGNGAKIKVTGKTEGGQKLGKINKTIRNNIFTGEFDIPEDIELGDEIYFEVKLPNNDLEGESSHIPVYPQPKAKNMKWSAKEARRGDVLTLSADLEDVRDGTEVTLVIYEFDADGGHDIITDLKATVKESKIEEKWEYEYHESTVKISSEDNLQKYDKKVHYSHPEYFFTIKIGGFELGKEKRDSGLLLFKDWIELKIRGYGGEPLSNADYTINLPDNKEKKGKLNEDGFARVEDVPPGPYTVTVEVEEESQDDIKS